MTLRRMVRLALPAMVGSALVLGGGLRAWAASGDLDGSFGGGDGIATQDFGGASASHGHAALLQPDGKIVAAGSTVLPSRFDADFGVARFLSNGDPDPAFGTGGAVSTNFLGGHDVARAILRQSDGKLVVVGDACELDDSSACGFAVVRYLPSGKRDLSFSGDGRERIEFPGYDDLTGFNGALMSGGKILIVGDGNKTADGQSDMVLARLNGNGSLDTTFSGDGRQTLDPSHGGDDGMSGVAIQSDGKIVGSGWAYNGSDGRWCVVRLKPNGTLDTTFSGDGVVIKNVVPGQDDYSNDLIVLPSSRILAIGRAVNAVGVSTGGDVVLLRLTSGGVPDTSFGAGGLRKADFGGDEEPVSVARDSTGRIVMSGRVGNGTGFGVFRFTAAGAPDTTFAGDGLAVEGGGALAAGIAVQGNDRPVAVGSTSQGPGDLEVARFLA
ncbi:MAG: hypothetical protein ACJ77A_03135 [Actinomycetota bacterium]